MDIVLYMMVYALIFMVVYFIEELILYVAFNKDGSLARIIQARLSNPYFWCGVLLGVIINLLVYIKLK